VVAGVLLGVGVWVLFGVTLLFCHYRKYRLYHIGVLFVEVLWFIDFITFLYGIYKYPLY
ncbi:MAG: hypothetical protein HGA46_03850, partial [Chlorobiaceae bacterium]|nr:hypothetical protein [Chlorobiaceae bacterium]